MDKRSSRPHSPPVGLPRALKRARQGRMKQEEVAEKLGLDQSTISGWETSKAEPSLDQVARFEQAVGRPPGFVLVAAGYVEGVRTVEEAVQMDPALSDEARQIVLAAYRGAQGFQ